MGKSYTTPWVLKPQPHYPPAFNGFMPHLASLFLLFEETLI